MRKKNACENRNYSDFALTNKLKFFQYNTMHKIVKNTTWLNMVICENNNISLFVHTLAKKPDNMSTIW